MTFQPMTFQQRIAASLLAATAVIALAAPASADEIKGKAKGDFLIRARAVDVIPVEKGSITTASGASTGLDGRLNNNVIPELDFSYFLTDNIALELIAGSSRHHVTTSGAAAIDVGTIRTLPPTLTVQYHPLPKSQFSPYVGAGINYTLFWGAKDAPGFTGLKVDPSVGWALQAGADFFVTDKIFLNVDVKKIWLDSTLKTNLGTTGLRSSVDINPWLIGAGIGYKF